MHLASRGLPLPCSTTVQLRALPHSRLIHVFGPSPLVQHWSERRTCTCAAQDSDPGRALPGPDLQPSLAHQPPSSESQSSPATQPPSASLPPATPGSIQAASVTSPPSATALSVWSAAIRFIDQQILPILLVSMMVFGAAFPSLGQAAATAGLTRGVTIFIFIIAGLQLRRGEAAAALKAWGCVLFGLASILLFTPLLGLGLQALPWPAELAPLVLGTAVFCAMPTTLSSGISMTTAAGGNTALAILLTITSNLLGVLTLPCMLPWVCAAAGSGPSLSAWALLQQLCVTVLLPTLLGAAVRGYVPGVAQAIDTNKRAVVWVSSACLAIVPWMQVSRAVGSGLSVPLHVVALSFLLGTVVHVAFLLFNWAAVQGLGLGGQEPLPRAQLRQALVLQASQKTLPVAIAVVSEGAVAAQLGPLAAGLASLGAVAGHLAQVLVDSMLIGAWSRYIQAASEQQMSWRQKAA